MKKIFIIICSLYFFHSLNAQTLQSVTTSGNTTSLAIRINGEANVGTSGSAELVLGVLTAPKTNDTRAFIGWKNDPSTNNTTNGYAGALLLQPRTNLADMSIDFATGYLTPQLRMRIAGNGHVSIGDNALIPPARLFVKAAGNTNASTALLIQNSSSTELLRVLDNGNIGVGTGAPQSQLNIKASTDNPSSLILLEKYTGAANDRIGGLRFVSGYQSYGYWSGIEGYGTGGVDQMDLRFYTSFGSGQQSAERMRITQLGSIGIGTINPAAKLDIVGAGGSSIDFQTTGRVKIKSAVSPGLWLNDNAVDKTFFGYAPGFANHAAGIYTSGSGQWNSFNVFQDGSVSIGSAINNTNAKLDVTGNIYCNSKMYIGTADAATTAQIASYSLAVNGTAIFNKAKVKLYGAWPDYVFEDQYKLMPLPEVENFLKQNKHLPEVPSATETAKNGIDLGDNQSILLKKVEELTLYLIEQNKRIDAQLAEINNLKNQVGVLQKK